MGVADVDEEEPEAATFEAVGGCVRCRDKWDGHQEAEEEAVDYSIWHR